MTSTSIWVGLAALGVAVLGMIVEIIRALGKREAGFNVLALLAALGGGAFMYLWQRNVWIALIFSGLVFEAFGNRWGRIVRLNNPPARILYYLIFDAGVYYLFYASWWLWWHKGFYTVLVTLGGRFLEMLILPYLLRIFFPVIARQELAAVMRAGNMADQAAPLERDAGGILQERRRRRVLRRLNNQKRQIAHAQKLHASRRQNQAFKLVNGIILELTSVHSLASAQQQVLGDAYLLRGKIHRANRLTDSALQDFDRARQWVPLDDVAMGALAMRIVQNNDRSEDALKLCLDFLRARRHLPPDEPFNQVMDYLQKGCLVTSSSTQAQIHAAMNVARKTLEVLSAFPPAQMALGHGAVLLGEWEAAQAPLEAVRKVNPRDPLVHALLGQVHAHFNRHAEAAAELAESLKLNEKQPDAAFLLGSIYLRHTPAGKEESLKLALQWLKAAASMTPDNPVYRAELAQAYALAGDKESARSEANEALKLDPNHAEANLLMADLLFEKQKWEEASGYYERLHLIQPSNPAAALKLGVCLVALKKMPEAEVVLEPIAALEPKALLPLGRTRLAGHQFDKAEAALRESLEKAGETPETLYWLGCTLAWKAAASPKPDYQPALDLFKRVGMSDGIWAGRASLQMGHIALRQQDINAAAIHYSDAQPYSEISLEAGLAQARMLLANGRLKDAEAALKAFPRDVPLTTEVWNLRGIISEMQGALSTAVEEYRRAENDGSLGVVLYLLDRPGDAAAALRRALAGGDRSDRVLYYSGWIAALDGDYPAAVQLWTELQQRHPDEARLGLNLARAWYLAGVEQYKKGEYLKAAEAWEHYYVLYQTDDDLRAALRQMILLAAWQSMGTPTAVKLAERARRLGAPQTEADLWEGLAHLSLADADAAVVPLARLAAANPDDPVAAYNYGMALLRTGKALEALPRLELAAERIQGENRRQILLALSMCQLAQGDLAAARRTLEESGMPSQPEESLLLAIVQLRQGNLVDAHQLAKTVRSIPALRAVAAAFTSADRLEDARQAYHDVLALDEDDRDARCALGGVLLAQAARAARDQRWQAAREALQEAAKLDAENPAPARYLEAVGSAEITAGGNVSGEDAINLLENLLKRIPENPRTDVIHQLAMLYHRQAIVMEVTSSHSARRDDYWRRTLAYWAMAVEDDSYWMRWVQNRRPVYEQDVSRDDMQRLRYETIRSRVREVHQQFVGAYSTDNKPDDAVRHRKWMAQWNMEMVAAHALHKIMEDMQKQGRSVSYGIPSGPLYWKLANVEDRVRRMAEEALKILPDEAQIILDALNPVGMARSLLKEAQLEEAIDILQAHLDDNPNDRQARELIQQALLDQVRTLAASDLDGALTALQRLKTHGGKTADAEKLIVAETLKDVDKLLEDGNPREAGRLVEMALKILPASKPLKDKQSQVAVSQIAGRVSQAIERVNHAIADYRSGSLGYDEAIAEFNAALKILDEARRATPGDHKIIKHYHELAVLRADLINSEAVKITNHAADIAGSDRSSAINDLDTAVRMLEEAHHNDPDNQQISRNLESVRQSLKGLRGY